MTGVQTCALPISAFSENLNKYSPFLSSRFLSKPPPLCLIVNPNIKVSEIPNESKKADFVTKLFTARQIGKTRLLPQAHELAMG